MIFVACLISGLIGFSICAILASRQYEKGWKDGRGQYDK